MNKFYIPATLLECYTEINDNQAVKRLNGLLDLMNEAFYWDDIKKIYQINKFFNQVEYQSDIKAWNKKDYWASRLEFLGKGCGDCEDFAVAKYLTLKQLGVKGLYLTYALMVGTEERHLLVSYLKKYWAIYIDNYNKEILPVTSRSDIAPVYAFTEDSLFLQNSDGLGKQIKRNLIQPQIKLNKIPLEIEVKQD